MLKSLIEFFLLLSNDKKTITTNSISSFYQFITKKLPEIENHRPNLITSLLNNYNTSNKIEKKCNKEIEKIILKNNLINNFQNELLSLLNDMLDYLYGENAIFFSDDKKDILKNKKSKKLIEKDVIPNVNDPLNDMIIQDIRKTEIINYIKELMKNNKLTNNYISLNLTIKHFINFFNVKNKDKNRQIAQKFVNIINPLIKIYKTDKKIIYHRKIKKIKTKSLSKIPVININNNNNIFKEKTYKNKNIKNNNSINNCFYKVNNSFNNKSREKERFNLNNIIIKKHKRNTVTQQKKIIKQKDDEIKEQKQNNNPNDSIKESNTNITNLTHDTIPCQTLNNCISFNNFQKNNIIENYLNNINIKNNKNIIINNKDNKIISKKIIINNIRNMNSNSQDNKNYNIKSKSCKSSLYNDDFDEFNENSHRNKNIEDYNYYDDFQYDKIGKKRKSTVTSPSQKEEYFNGKYAGCSIY